MRRRLRGSDFAGRIGGEEFLVAFEDCAPEDALQLLDRLGGEFAHLQFSAEGQRWSSTLSAGIAGLSPGETPQALLERADRALYRAKAEGRNRCVIDADTSP
jgi:diguanylate cyclase (GGDEF)-like protein